MTTATLDVSPTAITDARTKLDAWVRELMAWHFDPATGAPFWLEWAQKAGWDPRKEVKSYADLDKFERLPGRVAPRGRGAPLAAEGLRGPAGVGLRDRRQHRPAEGADQHRRLPHRLRDVQRHPPRRRLPARRRLAVDRAVRPAPPAPRRRAPRAAPRRHLLHARPRPALGDQAPEVAGDRTCSRSTRST